MPLLSRDRSYADRVSTTHRASHWRPCQQRSWCYANCDRLPDPGDCRRRTGWQHLRPVSDCHCGVPRLWPRLTADRHDLGPALFTPRSLRMATGSGLEHRCARGSLCPSDTPSGTEARSAGAIGIRSRMHLAIACMTILSINIESTRCLQLYQICHFIFRVVNF